MRTFRKVCVNAMFFGVVLAPGYPQNRAFEDRAFGESSATSLVIATMLGRLRTFSLEGRSSEMIGKR